MPCSERRGHSGGSLGPFHYLLAGDAPMACLRRFKGAPQAFTRLLLPRRRTAPRKNGSSRCWSRQFGKMIILTSGAGMQAANVQPSQSFRAGVAICQEGRGLRIFDGARDIGAGTLVALIRYLILAKHSFSRSSSDRTCVSMAVSETIQRGLGCPKRSRPSKPRSTPGGRRGAFWNSSIDSLIIPQAGPLRTRKTSRNSAASQWASLPKA